MRSERTYSKLVNVGIVVGDGRVHSAAAALRVAIPAAVQISKKSFRARQTKRAKLRESVGNESDQGRVDKWQIVQS